MRIRITAVGSVSDGEGLRFRHGQVVDVDDDLAAAWIRAGHAVRERAPGPVPKAAAVVAKAARRATGRKPPRAAERPSAPPTGTTPPPGPEDGTGEAGDGGPAGEGTGIPAADS
ncbi:hypothetical protein OG401_21045 [Kitasatospora purpeofusca]|uniref:hypothetical protein n=1 Tax=Kitasatospora purpeofusca TaxID=67352 RepID=UPI002257060E|nr:hypothetical protein [Kitasatospora purpeofusca]MCX4686768.1 hypothetical protein [Kitasatospora purpeofusca]